MVEDEKKAEELSFEADAGKGFEEMKSTDFSMPLLSLLQANSPELLEGNEKYDPEARPGRIYNTATRQTYRECTVLPVRFKSKYVEWVPRTQGGGFVDSYDQDTLPRDTAPDPIFKQLIRPNGNYVIQTDYYLCLLKEENWDRVIIALKSTQLKKARKWNALMFAQRGTTREGAVFALPFYSTFYKLSVAAESNAKGNWFGWRVDIVGRIDLSTQAQLYSQAREVHQTQIDFLPQRLIAMRTAEDSELDTAFHDGAKADKDHPF